jgi:hypothetical protein
MTMFNTPGSGKRFTRLFLLHMTAYTLLLAGLFWLFIASYNAKTLSSVKAREQALVMLVRKSIQRELHSLITDVRLLFSNRIVANYPANPSTKQADKLADYLMSFLLRKENIVQARIIDPDGQENIRIERVGRRIVAIPPSKLQNKHKRYYLKAALAMPTGHSYVSPLDLNIDTDTCSAPCYRSSVSLRFCETGQASPQRCLSSTTLRAHCSVTLPT